MILWATAIGIIGKVYPRIKSVGVKGVVYKRKSNDPPLSFAIMVAENKVINASPKTVIPGVKLSISNSSTGILACIALNNKSKTSGKPSPKKRVNGSRKISFAFLFANVSILIASPP
jgi:hypothetical protein